jgi:hypothetical protein
VSTKKQRAVWRSMVGVVFHRVDGYGGSAWCGRPWHHTHARTVLCRATTCRGCQREWAAIHGGVTRSAGGMWKVDGRRYRSRRLALLSTLEVR